MTEPPKKRVKLSSNAINVNDLQSALNPSQNVDILIKNLTTLRNQLSFESVSSNDSRLLFAQEWLSRSVGASNIFQLWESLDSRQTSIQSLILGVLSSLLNLLSTHYTYHTYGSQILKNLLSPQYIRRIHGFINGSSTDCILGSIKLLNSLSNFASGKERKNLLETFHFDTKTWNRLLNMRRKTKGKGNAKAQINPLDRPDIRTLTIFFILSFLFPSTPVSTKNLFLSTHTDGFLAIFKGLVHDPYIVIRKFLEVCWEGIWCDPKVGKKVKVGLFRESTVLHLIKLYDRTSNETEEQEPQISADLIHHFLLAICTRPGEGICFRDAGWYPPSDFDFAFDDGLNVVDEQEDRDPHHGGGKKVYNKILRTALKILKPTEDLRQQELVLRILRACPELVAGYWSTANLTLDPRLSSRWLGNVAVLRAIVSLPVPEESFRLSPSSSEWSPTPPPFSTIMENIFPSPPNSTKGGWFTKGLQVQPPPPPQPSSRPSTSANKSSNQPSSTKPASGSQTTMTNTSKKPEGLGLVHLYTAQALCTCLMKYVQVRDAFRRIADALDETTLSDSFLPVSTGEIVDVEEELQGRQGQWRKCLLDLEREVRKRVPEFGVVVSFVSRIETESSEMKSAVLSEVAHRLLWLYHDALPGVMGEVKYDFGRLLSSVNVSEGEEEVQAVGRLGMLKQVHILRLLSENEAFKGDWSGRSGNSRHTNLHILLKAFGSAQAQTNVPAPTTSTSAEKVSPHPLTSALRTLLVRILSDSIAFRQPLPHSHPELEQNEVSLWLSSLPILTRPTKGSESPDGASLTSELDSVVAFLDECVQRCVKVPYRYVDLAREVCKKSNSASSSDTEVDEEKTPTDEEEGEVEDQLSPLLMTVVEQLKVKVHQGLVIPSDVLAVLGFFKKLLFKLSLSLSTTGRGGVGVVRAVAEEVAEIFNDPQVWKEYPVMSRAVLEEVKRVRWLVSGVTPNQRPSNEVENSESVKLFLDDVEKILPSSSSLSQRASAYELVDFVRLVDQPLSVQDVQRVVKLVRRLNPKAVEELVWCLPPPLLQGGQRLMWDGVVSVSESEGIMPPFTLLFRHTTTEDLASEKCREILGVSACGSTSSSHPELELVGSVLLIARALAKASVDKEAPHSSGAMVVNLLHLLHAILKTWKEVMRKELFGEVKRVVFGDVKELKQWFVCDFSTFGVLMKEGHQALQDIVTTTLDPNNDGDRALVESISEYWVERLKNRDVNSGVSSLAFTWIGYASIQTLFRVFDFLVSSLENIDSTLSSMQERIYETLWSARLRTRCEFEEEVKKRMDLLMESCATTTTAASTIRNRLLEIGMKASLPSGIDGLPLISSPSSSLSDVDADEDHLPDGNGWLKDIIDTAEKRWNWSRRVTGSGQHTNANANTKANIIAYTLYTSPSASHESTVRAWFETANPGEEVELRDLAKVCFAYLDICRCLSSNGAGTVLEKNPTVSYFDRFVEGSMSPSDSSATRTACSACVSILLQEEKEDEDGLVGKFKQQISELPVSWSVTPELLDVGLKSSRRSVKDVLVNWGLQSVVRVLTGDEELGGDDVVVIGKLEKLAQQVETIKPHIAEPVLIAVIQHRLSNVESLRLLQVILSKVSFKPLIINRHLQSIVQSPQFHKAYHKREGTTGTLTTNNAHALHAALSEVLHILFYSHPSNTCQPSHIQPLLRIYRGTLSVSDRKLLGIFRLFEREKKVSVGVVLGRWSPSPNESSNSDSAMEMLKSLDSGMVLRTCLRWPKWRKYGYDGKEEDANDENHRGTRGGEDLYDPIFLILFLTHTFSSSLPTSAIDWVELFRTNILGLCIRALSSRDPALRNVAAAATAKVWNALEGPEGDMLEKPHVVHIFSLLRDAVVRSRLRHHDTSAASSVGQGQQQQPRIPSHITLLLAHALRGVFYPSNFIYPLTARFLLQRPELDLMDVPMLYSMLYSSNSEDGGGQWKKERSWMLKFLADGLQNGTDWKVFKRRHMWDLVASLFGAERDRGTRRGVLEILANLTCIPQAMTSLLLKSNLLSWIEIQLQLLDINSTSKVDQEQRKHEIIAWIKILENVLISANREKVEDVTRGEWRVSAGRCSGKLLEWCIGNPEIGSDQVLALLHLISRVMLRLKEYPSRFGDGNNNLNTTTNRLLEKSVSLLRRVEKTMSVDTFLSCSQSVDHDYLRPPSPHESRRLFDLEADSGVDGGGKAAALSVRWSGIVEELWRISMSLPFKSQWDALTCRLLVSGSLIGSRATREAVDGGSVRMSMSLAEWARREVVRNMCDMHDSERSDGTL
ncbi:hypothetical protein L218DRAFT_1077444 [Marasmius fiardii PR-910]|nr:hypothetical protein L218DRAFT_1077444 [Marasmius fiardii PR-910]